MGVSQPAAVALEMSPVNVQAVRLAPIARLLVPSGSVGQVHVRFTLLLSGAVAGVIVKAAHGFDTLQEPSMPVPVQVAAPFTIKLPLFGHSFLEASEMLPFMFV